ncbi:nucleotide sugar dehydrogenase [Abyssibacter sp.]|uniref:nucleotide sugar dehydrogenase n=1 Tax=Abyssibacter sp. TaxID=2320200 RepID=UPI0035197D59
METVAVIGLGYVGLPLALAFGQHLRTIGLDSDSARINVLRGGSDPTRESPPEAFAAAERLEFTADASLLSEADVVIIAVPTPINEAKQPDLRPLEAAGRAVGEHLKRGGIVVLESTVYPGLTDEWLAPLIERCSGYTRGKDFRMAYSPERINPGDREHSLRNTVKVVAAEDETTLAQVASLYERVVEAGVYRAKSIPVAEAAKVIENTQRDLNIALMNELAIIFNRLGIDTLDVLETAGTKWNFLPFRPGLVGGHCIGVDPYYLTYRAEAIGYHPEVILAGRRINDNFGRYVASRTIKAMIHAGCSIAGARVAVLGVTFKEDCPDTRNSRVFDLIDELVDFGTDVIVVDPVADLSEVSGSSANVVVSASVDELTNISAVVFAVGHRSFRRLTLAAIAGWCNSPDAPVIDVKGLLDRDACLAAGVRVDRV